MSTENLSNLDISNDIEGIDRFLESLEQDEIKSGGALASSKTKLKSKPISKKK